MSSSARVLALVLAGVLSLVALGCTSARIAISEQFGYAKREQLVDQVQKARDEQEEAKDQFVSALEAFSAVTDFEGGALERVYSRLNRELKRSQDQADDVRGRIATVRQVGDALFGEWERELGDYQSEAFRSRSEQQLRETRSRYGQLLAAMERAAGKMDPVLAAFGDQVLFLKHNLNARAIASLGDDLGTLEADVAALISDMERSIEEANAFIESLESPV